MIIDADIIATQGIPYLVQVGLQNVSDVPIYNAASSSMHGNVDTSTNPASNSAKGQP